MRRVVLDENLPKSFGTIFVSYGFTVFDVRDHGLRGASDSAVFHFAISKESAIVTSDVGFVRRIHLLQQKHYGIFLVRLPAFLSLTVRRLEMHHALEKIVNYSVEDATVVVTPGMVRSHKRSIQE